MDSELARISKDLRWVESQGAKVERVNLTQEPDAFVQNRRVVGLMQAFGEGALPAVLVNREVEAHGRYPSREEMLEAAKGSMGGEVGAGQTDEQAPRFSGCEPGSGCC